MKARPTSTIEQRALGVCARQSSRACMVGRPAEHQKAQADEREGMGGMRAKEDMQASGVDDVELKAVDLGERWAHRKRQGVVGTEEKAGVVEITKDEEYEDTRYPYTHSCGSGGCPMEEVGAINVSSPCAPSHHQNAVLISIVWPSPSPPSTMQPRRGNLNQSSITNYNPHSDCHPRKRTPHDYTPGFRSKLAIGGVCGLGRSPWYGVDTAGAYCTAVRLPLTY